MNGSWKTLEIYENNCNYQIQKIFANINYDNKYDSNKIIENNNIDW